MTRETRIGLLIGLGFVVVFGLVLSELTSPEAPASATASETTATAYPHTYVIDESPSASGQRTVRISRSRGQAQLRRAQAAGSDNRTGRVPAVHAAQVRQRTTNAPHRYAVQRGDTLVGIARKMYGPGREGEYRRIFQANRNILSREGIVHPGQVLVIPPLTAAVLPASAGDAAVAAVSEERRDAAERARSVPRPIAAAITHNPPARTYVVKATDTLPEIAYTFYGDDSRKSVMKIYDANREKLEGLDHLPVGLALAIPH